MSDLSEFLDSLLDERPEMHLEDASTDQGMQAASDRMLPIYERLCERAGVEQEELNAETAKRVQGIVKVTITRIIATSEMADPILQAVGKVTITRIIATSEMADPILQAVGNGFIDGFLMGALWEQNKQMPDLDLRFPSDG